MIGPKDFFDTLVATNWATRFESFSEDEVKTLRLYDRLAHELGQRSFFASPQELKIKAGGDESYQRLEHAGEDSLRSMTMTFRQLFQDGEPARFESVRAILRQHAAQSPEGAELLMLVDLVGRRYKVARRRVLMAHVWLDDPMGEPKEEFRAGRVIDDWLNGVAFHSDADKASRVQGWSPIAYEWSLIEAIHEIAGVMWELHIVVMGAIATAENHVAPAAT